MRIAAVVRVHPALVAAVTTLGCAAVVLSLAAEEPAVNFDRDVAPIFVTRCLECHQAREAAGDLVLTTVAGMKQGGASGPALRLGDANASLLVQRLEAGEMPPPKKGHSSQLPATEITVLRRWIDAGANWPAGRVLDLYERTTAVRAGRDWWSLQPISVAAVPPAPDGFRIANPVDVFVATRLAADGWQMAPSVGR